MDDDLHDFMFPEVRSFLNLEKWLFLDQKPGFVQAFDKRLTENVFDIYVKASDIRASSIWTL